MEKKSRKTLEERIAILRERGIDGTFCSGEVIVAEIVDVVGDLTLREFNEMLSIARARAAVSSTSELRKPNS